MMRNTSPMRAAAALLLVALAGGCLGGGSTPERLFTLQPLQTRDPGEVRRADQGEVLTVLTPSIERSANTTRIPVYVTTNSIQYLQDAVWAEQPAPAFRRLLSETVAARTGRLVLDPALYTQVQGAVVSGEILRFGFDPVRNEAVVEFEATVTRAQTSVASNRFEARVPVTQPIAAEVAPALNQAANRVAEQVADWIGR